MREGGTLEQIACGFVDRGDGYPDALWGSTPMSTFMRAYLRFGRTSKPSTRAKDIPTSRAAHIPLLSHFARRSIRRDASRE
jgi:hypothetical protein